MTSREELWCCVYLSGGSLYCGDNKHQGQLISIVQNNKELICQGVCVLHRVHYMLPPCPFHTHVYYSQTELHFVLLEQTNSN